MGYVLELDETVSEGIPRIIAEKIQSAIKYLQETDSEKRDEAILEARTDFKRIRAALRLVRKAIGEEIYQQQNIFYRDIARTLSPVRDAYVVIETLDKAVVQINEPDIQNGTVKIRALLVKEYETVKDEFWGQENVLEATIEKLECALSSIDTIQFKKTGFKALEAGLFKTYQRGYKLLPIAYTNLPDIEPFHEWRKRIKYLRYQLQILKDIQETKLTPYIKDIKVLADYLGDAHDFAVLKKRIIEFKQTQAGAGRQLLAQLDYLRGQLENDAKPVADTVYNEEPEEFVKHIRGYWKSRKGG